MADLSNLKIANTFSRLLQVDPDTTQLQDGTGDNPSTIIFNGTTLKYVDGNQQNNYILTSDANGVARWAANSGGGGSTDVYWSANTDGTISPSGLTTSVGIGTTTPNSTLTVVGGVSATTFLSTNVINAASIAGSEFNSTSDTGYKINTNKTLWVDGGDTQVGNASLDTDILGSTINLHAPTSGGSLTLKETLTVTGNTVMNGTLSATTSCKIGNGDGSISAATINGVTINGTTIEGTIDGGTF
jgi:hypothetical protein